METLRARVRPGLVAYCPGDEIMLLDVGKTVVICKKEQQPVYGQCLGSIHPVDLAEVESFLLFGNSYVGIDKVTISMEEDPFCGYLDKPRDIKLDVKFWYSDQLK